MREQFTALRSELSTARQEADAAREQLVAAQRRQRAAELRLRRQELWAKLADAEEVKAKTERELRELEKVMVEDGVLHPQNRQLLR